jgi:RNA polymerase sigma-70 factor (ECF subfamily)
VKNKSLNYLRDTKKFNREILAIEGLIDGVDVIQNDRMTEEELKKKISESLAELPEKCREIFILSRHENLKYQEIADRQKISVKTVETQMSKALQHFRTRLAEYLPVLILWFLWFRK